MAFREESEDAFTAIKELCKERGLKWCRTDQDPTTNRVYQRIVSGIQRTAFVIADVTVGTLNVYYELGYAEARGKPVIVIGQKIMQSEVGSVRRDPCGIIRCHRTWTRLNTHHQLFSILSCSLVSFLGVPKQLARQGGFSGRSRMLRRGVLGRILSWPVRYSDLRLAPDYAELLERGTAQAAAMARAFGITGMRHNDASRGEPDS